MNEGDLWSGGQGPGVETVSSSRSCIPGLQNTAFHWLSEKVPLSSLLSQKKLLLSIKANMILDQERVGECLVLATVASGGQFSSVEGQLGSKASVSRHQLHTFYMRNFEKILIDNEIAKCIAFVF